jgi:cephalosporin hydroxylase
VYEPDAEGVAAPPPAVEIALGDRVADLWAARAQQVLWDSYAGVPMAKFPEDLRVYEHLMWLSRPDVVIEIGAYRGGSALWFRDRLRTLAGYGRSRNPRVISLELDAAPALSAIAGADPGYAASITVVEGDVRDERSARAVERLVPSGARCMVVEDSAHTFETTMAALANFSSFVEVGGFFVVEDGCVDIEQMRVSEDWPRGVLPALQRWLEGPQGGSFRVRRDLEVYGISCHPRGFLQRIA